MFVEVAKKGDIAPGGMKGYTVKGSSIVLCNEGGKFYAVSGRCGHMRARLEKGTLVGYILTCPWHYSQFDIHDGRALSGPVPCGPGVGANSASCPSDFFRRMGQRFIGHIRTSDLKTFKVMLEGESIKVDL
ncbi:MAG: Rieske (2Fe-2S) protein [Thermodesulfobacteriota bacterium]